MRQLREVLDVVDTADELCTFLWSTSPAATAPAPSVNVDRALD